MNLYLAEVKCPNTKDSWYRLVGAETKKQAKNKIEKLYNNEVLVFITDVVG